MTVSAKNILVPIVIEIVDSHAPAAQRQAQAGNTRQLRNVYELPISYISKDREGFVCDGSDDDVVPSVVIEVAKVASHGGNCATVTIIGNSRLQGNFLEGSIPQIMEEEIRLLVVGNKNIQETVVVHVPEGQSHTFAQVRTNA